MITLFSNKYNHLSQSSYSSHLDSLQLHRVKCTCGNAGSLIKYGHYNRSVKNPSGTVKISIQRVLCRICGATHAILPSSIVPYSQVSLSDQLMIIKNFLKSKNPLNILNINPEINVSNIYLIITRFLTFWLERLRSLNISVYSDDLIPSCFSLFHRQFMQIRPTRNILFSPPTQPVVTFRFTMLILMS